MSESLTNMAFIQYYRQILLPEVGELGQQTLAQSHILVIGVGGLGTHVAQQLAAAGIGYLYLMDDDNVALSNLPRQILFRPTDVGQPKVNVAQKQLQQICPTGRIATSTNKFSRTSINLFSQDDALLAEAINKQKLLVLDCSDNIGTRQNVNQWCINQQLTLVSAAITGFNGQLLLVDMQSEAEAGCYRCIFNHQELEQDCQSMGVLGPAVAAVASMQALLALKHLVSIGLTAHYLHVFDGLTLSWQKLKRKRDDNCLACQTLINRPSHLTCHEEPTL